jgi:hypothetical protein
MLDPPLSPPSTQEEFFGASAWEVNFFEKKIPKNLPRGQGGPLNLKPHTKFENPTIAGSGRKVTTSWEKKEREKNAVNSGHLVL